MQAQLNVTYRVANPFATVGRRPGSAEENATQTAARRQASNLITEKRRGRPFKPVQVWTETDGIATTQIGGYTITVDRQNLHLVKDHRWYLLYRGLNVYACTGQGVYMHRVILGLERHVRINCDHINHNGLDNRRENLRPCNQAQNRANSRKHRNASSRFKGVRRHGKKWLAEIGPRDKRAYLGLFESEEAAARAVDAKSIELYGEFAKLNFETKNQSLAAA